MGHPNPTRLIGNKFIGSRLKREFIVLNRFQLLSFVSQTGRAALGSKPIILPESSTTGMALS
jgi:hypothetical protein